MTWTCIKGHQSDDPVSCSECGRAIVADPNGAAAAGADPLAPETGSRPVEDCPGCGTPRVPGARYCEYCRHDFTVPYAGPAAVAAPAVPEALPPLPAHVPYAPATPAAAAPDPQVSPFYGRSVWAVVTVEASLVPADEQGTLPADRGPWTFPLDFPENLVGRRGSRTGVHPEVPVDDKAVSARHAKFCRKADGITVIDIGSSNGTRLNGAEMRQGVEVGIMPGDTVDIGAWTRIVLETR